LQYLTDTKKYKNKKKTASVNSEYCPRVGGWMRVSSGNSSVTTWKSYQEDGSQNERPGPGG